MSARIKNYILYIDNYRVEIDDNYNVYSENSDYHYGKFIEMLNAKDRKNRSKEITNANTISKTLEYFFYVQDLIYRDHSNEIASKNKEFIGLWIPLLDTIRMTIQLSVANERLKDKENKIEMVLNFLFIFQNKQEIEKIKEETNNLKGRLVVYEEIKRKYEREKQEKTRNNDEIASSIYHQRVSSLDKFDQERKNVKNILFNYQIDEELKSLMSERNSVQKDYVKTRVKLEKILKKN